MMHEDELVEFCNIKQLKTRGELILNILNGYKDAENIYLYNYVNIGYRNFSALKENGIVIKESKLTKLPYSLLMQDVLIQESLVLKAIAK